jgi:uncharacterized protein (TIGR03790 family)
MIRAMFRSILSLGLLASVAWSAPNPIRPESVAVLYNTAVPDSKRLAEAYSAARSVPAENLIGLDLPAAADISRADYISKIQNPLRAEFDRRGWWSRGKDASGVLLPTSNDIRVILLIKGMPLRIQPAPLPQGFKPPENDPIAGRNEASVDSELAMFGVEGVPTEGVLKNIYFQNDKPFADQRFPFLILTARIDAATTATCERMISDPIEAEKTGLWGKAYVDIANKFPQGDQWLAGIVTANRAVGIPTVVDRFNDTLPMNYPMTDAALYYGWYDWNVSGPFLNPAFRFRKGAVAMHLHSFSAEQLLDPAKNWSAGLLEKGAAVTLGNVFEPYLGLTHSFEIVHNRLLAGHSWVEACWMSIPVTSWQGIVLGDPLYRPFLHFDGTGQITPADNDYRALRAAVQKWPTEADERKKQLMRATERMESGVLSEAIALEAVEAGRAAEAELWFRNAKKHYTAKPDQFRQDFHLAAMERAADRKADAIKTLRAMENDYPGTAEIDAAKGWLDILDPPPPPPATPKQ